MTTTVRHTIRDSVITTAQITAVGGDSGQGRSRSSKRGIPLWPGDRCQLYGTDETAFPGAGFRCSHLLHEATAEQRQEPRERKEIYYNGKRARTIRVE